MLPGDDSDFYPELTPPESDAEQDEGCRGCRDSGGSRARRLNESRCGLDLRISCRAKRQ